MSYIPAEYDFFVSLASSYETACLLKAHIEKNDNNRLYGSYFIPPSPGQKFQGVKKPIEEFAQPLFPLIQYRKGNFTGVEKEAELYWRVQRRINDYLLTCSDYSALISEIITHLNIAHSIPVSETEDIIKVLIAESRSFSYKKRQSGEYLKFSDLKEKYENSRRYYGSLAEEIKIKSNKISLLVSHGPSVGNYREHILRTLLRKYIPSKFSVATGFIEGKPYQLDIIIYDSQNFTPSFSEGELVVICQEAVRAVIEVKSQLNATTLRDALELMHSVSLPGYRSTVLPMFKGIFAFDSDYRTPNTIAKVINDFYNEPYFDERIQDNTERRLMYLFHEITCVAVLNKHVVSSHYVEANDKENDHVIPKLFSVTDNQGNDIQTVTFLANLFNYLDIDYYAKENSRTAFSILSSASSCEPKMEFKLTEDDWLPPSYSEGEHEHTKESVKRRVSLINDWFEGKLTTSQYVLESFKKVASEIKTD